MHYKNFFKLSFVKSKIFRRIIRIAVGVFAAYILLLTCLSIYLYSSHNRLLAFLNAQVKKTILGELKINEADITVWQTFPKLGLTLENVSITDSISHTPFLKADKIVVEVGLIDLLGNTVTISSVKIKNAVIHTFTDANGYTNTYVLRSQPSQKQKRESKKPFVLKNINLNNVSFIIEDVPAYKRYQAKINNADIDMNFSGSKYYFTFNEDLFLRGLGFNMRQGYWLENQRLQAKWKLEFDTSGSVLTINKTKVKIQGHPFFIDGNFEFGKSQFHLKAVTENIHYAAALSALKPKTRTVLQKINLNQPLNATVSLTGSLSKKGDPAVKIDFSTSGNNMNTPVLNLNSCSFTGSFSNQYNPDLAPDDSNSRVQLNSFTSSWGTVGLKGKNIAVTNLDKPKIQFEFFSQCTFPQLDDALSSDVLRFVDGNAKLYLAYNGPLIADPSLLDQLDAKIQIQNGKVIYVPKNMTFSGCNGNINLTGNNLAVTNLRCNLNTNHFEININGYNLSRISSKEAGKATLNCNVVSPAVDLSDFITLFGTNSVTASKKKTGSLGGTARSIDNAVENGDVYINLKAQQLTLHNFKAGNANAVLLFNSDGWGIQKASLQFDDGIFNLSAKVQQTSNVSHQVNANIDLQHINVQKMFYSFDNFGQTGLTSKNISGIIDSKVNIIAGINNAGKFIPTTMNGKIYFSLKNAALINFEPFLNIQKIVFKNRNLDNVQFAELKDTFDIQNGDMYIHRMSIQSSALSMYVEGIYSFANNTDISIQVPLSNLKNNSDEDFNKVDKKKANKPGASIYLRAKDAGGHVKIGLDVFRKFRKNKTSGNEK